MRSKVPIITFTMVVWYGRLDIQRKLSSVRVKTDPWNFLRAIWILRTVFNPKQVTLPRIPPPLHACKALGANNRKAAPKRSLPNLAESRPSTLELRRCAFFGPHSRSYLSGALDRALMCTVLLSVYRLRVKVPLLTRIVPGTRQDSPQTASARQLDYSACTSLPNYSRAERVNEPPLLERSMY